MRDLAPGSDEWMVAKGWRSDPTCNGYDRWTRISDGLTAKREPYMSDAEWTRFKVKKAEVPAVG